MVNRSGRGGYRREEVGGGNLDEEDVQGVQHSTKVLNKIYVGPLCCTCLLLLD